MINNNLKKISGLLLLTIVLCMVICSPTINTIQENISHTKIKNKKFKQFILNNKENILNSCLNETDSIEYYNDIYKDIIKVIDNLEKNKYITKNDSNKLFKLLKRGELIKLRSVIETVSLTKIDTNSIANKEYLEGLISEFTFINSNTENFYINAIKTNKFNAEYYFHLANFYKRNCQYEKSIDTILQVSSILNNNNINNKFSNYYSFLGNLYFITRDYNNALVYYTNALVNADIRNNNNEKYNIISKIGDIMSIRGNNFEAINYYKYALSLKTKHVSTKNEIILLLKLSNTYYNYGNYNNGLKFAISAYQKSKLIGDKFLQSKAKYGECLNYEFLHNKTKAMTSCNIAIKNAEQYIMENENNVDGYINISNMLNYSTYVKNTDLARNYLIKALNLIDKNVLKKIEILEKIMNIDAYSTNFKNVIQEYEDLNNLYNKFNINIGCCNDILNGFANEKIGLSKNAEQCYLNAEKQLKDKYLHLSTLYSYMATYYTKLKQFNQALFYANKSLEISKHIYKYDHHRINNIKQIISSIEDKIK